MIAFPQDVEQVLRNAGWSPNRIVAIDSYITALEKEGYRVFPSVCTFLQQFGGLVLTFPYPSPALSITTRIHFCADQAGEAVYYEGYVSLYEQRIRRAVCVIGEITTGGTTLMMDAFGAVYGGFDDALVAFGTSGEQALIHLIQHCGAITVP